MAALDALTALTMIVFVPLMVWFLGRTGWSGDRKRVVVLAVAAFVAAVQAVLTGAIVVPEGWVPYLERVLISAAGFVTLNQTAYTMLWSKLPDSVVPTAEPAAPSTDNLYAGPRVAAEVPRSPASDQI